MPISAADLRFLIDRATGLAWRGLSSLRSRGLRSTLERVARQLRPVPVARRARAWVPEDAPFAPFAVPASETPRASIVIPVFNQSAHTVRCLRALAAQPPAAAVEVIVVDDGSSDDTVALLRQIDGLRLHVREANGGFIAACNDGLASARGEYVVFLNNDTVPQPGWLDALLATFDQEPGTGIAGSRLLYPDGRLQEAGGVVYRDGSADKLGRLRGPAHPAFSFLRRVDYCSGAAIALPRALMLELGGFDTHYAPAFYEDTDLAMKVRARGLQVLCNPFSEVLHVEGATAGTDTRHGVKAHQVVNQARFATRWARELEGHPAPGAPEGSLTDRLYGRTVLVVDALTPRPDRDSGSLRLVNLMRLLRSEGAHVVFAAADRAHDGGYTTALQRLGVEAWHAPQMAGWPAWLREHGARFDVALVGRHYVMREMLPLLRRHAPQAKLVFDSVDLHYLRERRGAEVSGDTGALRAAGRTRALELDVIDRSDLTLVVSAVERELLRTDAPDARVEVLSNLHEPGGPGLPLAQRRDVMFVGGFRHPPNVDAVLWFVEEVWPRVLARQPGLRFHCIGGDVPQPIARLGARPGVTIHGHVPDLTPWLEGCRVAVAPLRYGAGVKGKVNQPMAHGLPVVATNCAVEGMHLVPGVDVMLGGEADEFAAAVLQLVTDDALWQRLSDNGRENVHRHFSADAARGVIRQLLA
ncbi:glycosyltransferase [Lysobacter sp. GX 14042]|uniref:glycosyltransferase n=1 Tax=Lysobacter sp. GX 14042 TaxID=2907155 RepID=UPI001F4136E9|nr:glycosyltransferase [Lysobacter sp. GX 14042]MCE7031121.1 glycosyltransferase [Lysobacter sp. GX 14042]